jgi:hypothetical protein
MERDERMKGESRSRECECDIHTYIRIYIYIHSAIRNTQGKIKIGNAISIVKRQTSGVSSRPNSMPSMIHATDPDPEPDPVVRYAAAPFSPASAFAARAALSCLYCRGRRPRPRV